MKFFSAITIMAAMTALPLSSAYAFGEPGTWSSGWGQGVSEYLAVNKSGDELYIACSDSFPVRMTLTVGDHSYGSSENGDFALIIDGTSIDYPYDTASRVGANNFLHAWDLLRKAHSIKALTSDGIEVELPSQGSARVLPEWGTSTFSCMTEF